VVVLDRPVDGVEELAGLRVDSRVPQMNVGGLVDRDLPGEPEAVVGRLPAQLGRNRRAGDTAAGDDRLRRSGSAAQDAQSGGLLQIESVRSRRDGSERTEVGHAGGPGVKVLHQAAACEDDAAVLVEADGHMTAEDLEALEALVEVDVRDPGVGALHRARGEEIGHVRAPYAELGRVVGASDSCPEPPTGIPTASPPCRGERRLWTR
jgi:hypothetical protein